jgi:hypothetical protein
MQKLVILVLLLKKPKMKKNLKLKRRKILVVDVSLQRKKVMMSQEIQKLRIEKVVVANAMKARSVIIFFGIWMALIF